jgi:hypothetical protein
LGRARGLASPPLLFAIVARVFELYAIPRLFLNLQNTRPPNVPVTMTIDGYVSPGSRRSDDRDERLARRCAVRSPTPTPVRLAGHRRLSRQGHRAWITATSPAVVEVRAGLNGRSVGSVLPRAAPGAIDRIAGYWLPALATAMSPDPPRRLTWSAVAATGRRPQLQASRLAPRSCVLQGAADVDRWGRAAIPGARALCRYSRRLQNVRGVSC